LPEGYGPWTEAAQVATHFCPAGIRAVVCANRTAEMATKSVVSPQRRKDAKKFFESRLRVFAPLR